MKDIKPKNDKPGPKGKGPLDRIAALESNLMSIAVAMNKLAQEQEERLRALEETAEVFGEMWGVDAVADAVAKREQRILMERTAAAKDWLEKALAAGEVEPTATVTAESLVVGAEFDKAGAILGSGRVQVAVAKLPEAMRPDFIGKKPGDQIVTPEGGRFEIREAYVTSSKKAPEPAPVAEVLPPEAVQAAPPEASA